MNLRLNTLAGWCTVAVLAGLVGCGTTAPQPAPIVPIDAKGDIATPDTADTQSTTDAVSDLGSDDAYDNAACCKAAGATCGKVTGAKACKEDCGKCLTGKECNLTTHKCVVKVQLKKFGEACGPSKDCLLPKYNGDQEAYNADAETYRSCLDDQCDSGRCDFGLTFASSGICSMTCAMTADVKNNSTGANGPDGVEDDPADSECVDAVDGPAGSTFRCVQASALGQGSGNSSCRPGTTFKACERDGDCPATEACAFLPIGGKFGTFCQTRYKGPGGVPGKTAGELCSSGGGLFETATCANNFCFSGSACVGFCKTDADCGTSMKCVANQKLFTDLKETFSVCRPKSCESSKDCGADRYCTAAYNDVKSAGGDPDPKDASKFLLPGFGGECLPKTKGGKQGEACDPNTSNADVSAGLCEAWAMCIAGGCSSLCKTNADCVADQKCGTFQQIENVGTQEKPDYTSPQFSACIGLPGATTACADDGGCAKGQVCRWWTHLVDLSTETTKTAAFLTGNGICVTPGAKELANGALCGSNPDVQVDGVCASGICANRALGWQTADKKPLNIGACLGLCDSQEDCAGGIDVVVSTNGTTEHWNAFCRSDIAAYTPYDPYDPTGHVYRSACRPYAKSEKPVLCDANKKCPTNKQACFPVPIAGGPDKQAKVDFFCFTIVDTTDPIPTKKVGEICDANPDSTSATECVSSMCYPDIKTNVGYCSGLCASDADCGNGTVCDLGHQAVPRKDASKAAIVPVCVKKIAGIPCDYDSACHSDFRCTHTVPATTIGNPPGACAAQCSADADCATQGGGKCEAAKDRFGKQVPGVKVCSVK